MNDIFKINLLFKLQFQKCFIKTISVGVSFRRYIERLYLEFRNRLYECIQD